MLDKMIKNSLVWFPEKQIGYYPVDNSSYDKKYFNKYQLYASTEMGHLITKSRVDLVKKYYTGSVIDIGIGCGHFVDGHGNAVGYDINQSAVAWLKEKSIYADLYSGMYEVATFWDSLEHIENPDIAVSHIKKMIFVSMPIFSSEHDILSSKHFRKDEHYWYFTETGLERWLWQLGFECVEKNRMEVAVGRDGIGTFVFRRRNA